MPRILVTGGAGFIGSNLCKKLVKDPENHVICLDNLSTGRLVNIQELLNLSNFEFIEKDIIEGFKTEVDQVYNAACPASPLAYQYDPIHTIKTCVIGVSNMLDLATENNAVFLQFSTSEIYGDPLIHPQVETYRGNVNPIGIRACYDEGKRCAETLCFDYNRRFGTKIKVIRIFNTYGPQMDPQDGRVVSNFIMEALRGEDLTVYGDGSQTRSFQYVDDLLEGIDRMMNHSRSELTGPVNLGNPHEFTMLELAEKVLKKIGGKSKICFCSLPADDPTHRRPDISLAKSELNGWEPIIQLEEGLERTINYFKTRIGERCIGESIHGESA